MPDPSLATEVALPPVAAASTLARPGSLAPILLVAFLSSIGTAVVTNGIFFLTAAGYGFTGHKNYTLALIMGGTYVGAAFGVAPVLRRLASSHAMATRTVLSTILTLLGLLCFLPLIASGGEPGRAEWSVWTLVGVYTPLTGFLWPIVEGYVSGGRTGPPLRAAIGRFNSVWSSALVVAFSAPLLVAWMTGVDVLRAQPTWAIAGLGLIHLLTLPLVRLLPLEPPAHLEEGPVEHTPEEEHRYRQLLITFRVALPASYAVNTALGPSLPAIMGAVGVGAVWQMPAASAWLAARVLTFLTLEHWHGWHGRWFPPGLGAVLLLGGFALAILAPQLGPGPAAIACVVLGLGGFGVGMATIYSGALYYAMEVGRAEIDSGGAHEGLIGVGYTVGPLCGLVPLLAADGGLLAPGRVGFATLSAVGALAVVACGVVLARCWRGDGPRTAGGRGRYKEQGR